MELTVQSKKNEKILIIDSETGLRKEISYLDWCEDVVKNITLKKNNKYREAELKIIGDECYVEAF